MQGLGIDQSLTSTGYALWTEDKAKYDTIKTYPVDPLIVRHRTTVGSLVKIIDKYNVKYAAMEDYAYGTFSKQPKTAAKLCELGGQLKLTLGGLGLTIFVVNTKYVKQWIGIPSNSKKQEVVKAVNAEWDFKFRMKDNDIADALILGRVAEACWEKLAGLSYSRDLTGMQRGLVEAILGGEDTVLLPPDWV